MPSEKEKKGVKGGVGDWLPYCLMQEISVGVVLNTMRLNQNWKGGGERYVSPGPEDAPEVRETKMDSRTRFRGMGGKEREKRASALGPAVGARE